MHVQPSSRRSNTMGRILLLAEGGARGDPLFPTSHYVQLRTLTCPGVGPAPGPAASWGLCMGPFAHTRRGRAGSFRCSSWTAGTSLRQPCQYFVFHALCEEGSPDVHASETPWCTPRELAQNDRSASGPTGLPCHVQVHPALEWTGRNDGEAYIKWPSRLWHACV